MGVSAAKAFGIINSAEFITVLSSTLYSDAFLAVIREVVCNAWDAHKITNQTHIPVQIKIDETSLIIKDFGPGIDPAKMTEIYCTYGGSTKKAQENQTGGFGLGSKSPFAYTTHFTVTVSWGGKKTIWAISRGSADTKGMPDARIIVSVPTTETGVEVEIPINDPADVTKFKKVISQVVGFGEINATLNGMPIPTVPISKGEEGFLVTNRIPPSQNGLLYVRYGNVVYPIPSHREYEELYEGAKEILERSRNEYERGYAYSIRPSLNVIFEAAANSISVTPSRESIHASDRTIATITILLKKFIDAFSKVGSDGHLAREEQLIIDQMIRNKQDLRDMLFDDNIIKTYYQNKENKYRTLQGDFFSAKEVILGFAVQGYMFNNDNFLAKLKMARLNRAIKEESADKDLLIQFRKIMKEHPYMWDRGKSHRPHHIRYTGILTKAVKANLNPKNLIIWDREGYMGRRAFAGQELYLSQDSLKNLLIMSKRVVMIVGSKSQIRDTPWGRTKPDGWDYIPERGCLVYLMGARKYANKNETIRFFKKQGFIVIDIIAEEEKYAPKPLLAPTITKTDKPVFKKPKDHFVGLKTLIYTSGDQQFFGRRQHLDKSDEEKIWIKNPEFVFTAYCTRDDSYRARFFEFGDQKALEIVQRFGDKGAIALNKNQREKMIAAGAIDGETYVMDRIIEGVINNPSFKDYYQNMNWFSGYKQLNGLLYNDILLYTKLGKQLPKVPTLNEDELELLELFTHFRQKFKYQYSSIASSKKFAKAGEVIDEWKSKANKNPLKGIIADDVDKRLSFIDLSDILENLADDNTSPRNRAYLETLLLTTFLG
ncbi:rIIA-like lysis inhibitor [Agrobacterium phage OLIVR2]|uniref:RIIA-like lysis inhibitor n=2 Tax=root TaxID=1 RepID=A0A858MRT1_9CAUD|nr:RIIA lysis inhibitor [Agrobacterium phage OLIVR1]QIW87258.1 rIIA-like lysis inhibitor [Agrobacterium phage OLIVR1]QIW87366.1 rIIA-like lysis inhibitor [Agrobacterium phage OLIVR2]QIW87473.1 rIIA-like lysis inhibitor [Agrobacterium phage OLIVR3]